jgi:hypothetical protein
VFTENKITEKKMIISNCGINTMKYIIFSFFVLIWSQGLSVEATADEKNEPNFADMTLEELMDVPIITASRSEQTSSELSVPVSVLTAEEIRNS